MKKIEGPIWYSVPPNPPHPTPSNSAWRPRRVDAELDPGGRGKELVGKGLDTVRARLATERARYKWNAFRQIFENLKILLKKWSGVQFYKRNPFKRNFWKSQSSAYKMRRANFTKEIPLKKRVWKTQILAPNYYLKSDTFSIIFFKCTFPYLSFENKIPTPQLDIKISNP